MRKSEKFDPVGIHITDVNRSNAREKLLIIKCTRWGLAKECREGSDRNSNKDSCWTITSDKQTTRRGQSYRRGYWVRLIVILRINVAHRALVQRIGGHVF